MATWSTSPFGNDGAADWIDELVETSGTDFIEQTLQSSQEYDELPLEVGQRLHAALAVLAMLIDPKQDLITKNVPVELENWVAENAPEGGDVSPSVLSLAAETGPLLLNPDSAVLQEWQETDEVDQWAAQVRALLDVVAD